MDYIFTYRRRPDTTNRTAYKLEVQIHDQVLFYVFLFFKKKKKYFLNDVHCVVSVHWFENMNEGALGVQRRPLDPLELGCKCL